MIKLFNLIKNIIKVGRLISTDDTGAYSRGRVSYMGRDLPVMILNSYGHVSRCPNNSLALVMSQNAQESNGIAIVDDPNNRTLKNLKQGEVATTNYLTQDYIYFKEDGTTELVTDTLTIRTGSTIVTINNGQVTIDSANTEMNGNLQVNGTINATQTITSDVDCVGDGISLVGHTHGPGSLLTPPPASGQPPSGESSAPS